MFTNTCWHLYVKKKSAIHKTRSCWRLKFEINFWAKILGCKTQKRSQQRGSEHEDAAAPSAYIQLIQKEQLGIFDTLSCPVCKLQWIKYGLNSRENEWLHNLFLSFHHKWCQGNRAELSREQTFLGLFSWMLLKHDYKVGRVGRLPTTRIILTWRTTRKGLWRNLLQP